MSEEEKIVGQCKSSVSKELQSFGRIALHCEYYNCGHDNINLENDYKVVKEAIEELDKFKALLKKYEIKDIKALEELIKDYDDMAKALIQYTLGIEVEVKS